MRAKWVLVSFGVALLFMGAAWADWVADVESMSGVSGGLCVVLGCDDSALALDLAGSGKFLVHALDAAPETVLALRAAADAAGLGVRQIAVEEMVPGALPHVDNLVDLVLVPGLTDQRLSACPLGEILRVLRPRGKALLVGTENLSKAALSACLKEKGIADAAISQDAGRVWAVVVKPPIAGVDEWTHWEHRPDNNPVSTDTAIRAPYMTHFLGAPYYIAMPAITTAAGGRIFTAMGHIAHHEREEAWLNTLLARNGYNGMELWRRKLPDGYLAHRSAFIATEKTFYMIDPMGGGVLKLDPETGEEQGRIQIPELPREWKWIAMMGDTLYVLSGDTEDPAETTVVRSEIPAWSWGELSQGYYTKRVPWGFGTTVAAYDMKRGKLLWTHAEDAPVDSRAMVIGGDRVFYYCPDARVGCLDEATGKLVWQNDDPKVRELIEQEGQGLGSTPGFKSSCFSLYTPQALCFEAQTKMYVVALSPDTGQMLWNRTKTTNNPNMIYVDGQLLVGIGDDGNTLSVNPLTGETSADLGFQKRSCVRLTATPDSLFVRGFPEGLTRYDRSTGKITFNGAVRPACNDGVIGANGLLYIGPWLCDCNLQLMGTVALCSANDFVFERGVPGPERLTVFAEGPTSLTWTGRDWYAYRGNAAHSGSSRTFVAMQVDPLWDYRAPGAYTPTAPVSWESLVFVGGDDGKVRAIDATNGAVAWQFTTGGPIIQPPTLWNGRAFIGSGDG
ncbi:MAG: hypothetical protein QG656_136, partial [Candidatus Hydrogenedentes bacterium]|nr:hypothetical protein [Candidatus Hydrogenedentota bacterium]